MKADTVLDYAVFQLTPTRTRCELLISSKGVTEKLASGLLKPFLSHLRAAEEQLAAGGYSIKLEPPLDGKQNKAAKWFTKGTMQRFVRFVSTPEVLERVSAVESELLRLEDELTTYAQEGDEQQYGAKDVHKSAPKHSRKDDLEDIETEANETSRGRLLKAAEARQSMLQREQGMAFARAIAAGFDMDNLPDLITFSDHFGAARLREACLKFTALCKKQQEGGLWLDEMELVAAEGGLPYSDTVGTGITIAPGMDSFASPKDVADEDDSTSIKCIDDVRKDQSDNNNQQNRSSIDRNGFASDYPPVMGQLPPYGPWMQFTSEQAYDPRFFQPQNMAMPPYANPAAYGHMHPYWSQDNWRAHGAYNGTGHSGSAHEDELIDESVEKSVSKKSSRKSSPRRRTSPLKRLQVGRSGKRSGMVLIRNINYIASQQDANKGGTGSERNDSEDISEHESSSEKSEPMKKQTRENRRSVEASSEGSHSGATVEDKEETFVMPQIEPFVIPERATSAASGSDSFILEGERSGRASGHFASVTAGRSQASEDGMLLPQRKQRVSGAAASIDDSDLAFGTRDNSDFEQGKQQNSGDSFIIPHRGEATQQTNDNVLEQHGAPDRRREAVINDVFIVPSRNAPDSKANTTRTLEMDEQLYSEHMKVVENQAPKLEPDDTWILPERSTGKESLDKRWTNIDYDMEAMASLQNKQGSAAEEDGDEFYEQYREQRDAKLMKESGSKKAEREAKMKSLQDTMEKRKAEISARLKTTRSSILKSKKEKEEEERRRIEELAAQRRNRIAARSGGPGSITSRTPVNSRTSSINERGPSTAARNPVTRSVSSLTGVKKENAKPKPVDNARKSIASISELKKPETADAVKASDKKPLRRISNLSSGSGLRKASGTPAVSRSVKSAGNTSSR